MGYTFENLLKMQGYVVYTNIGTSMLPLLRQRCDIIEIRQKGSGRCKKYDVVFYKRGSRYILHRILKVLPEGYIIAGDHNTFVEKDITDEQILGVMTRVIRDGKEICMDDLGYQLYVHLWCDCYPVRMFIIRAKRYCRKMIYSLAKRILGKSGTDRVKRLLKRK